MRSLLLISHPFLDLPRRTKDKSILLNSVRYAEECTRERALVRQQDVAREAGSLAGPAWEDGRGTWVPYLPPGDKRTSRASRIEGGIYFRRHWGVRLQTRLPTCLSVTRQRPATWLDTKMRQGWTASQPLLFQGRAWLVERQIPRCASSQGVLQPGGHIYHVCFIIAVLGFSATPDGSTHCSESWRWRSES